MCQKLVGNHRTWIESWLRFHGNQTECVESWSEGNRKLEGKQRSRTACQKFQTGRYVEMASHLYITDDGKRLRWCQTFQHPWHPLLQLKFKRRKSARCFLRLFHDIVQKPFHRATRCFHTHAPRRGLGLHIASSAGLSGRLKVDGSSGRGGSVATDARDVSGPKIRMPRMPFLEICASNGSWTSL